MDGQTLCDNNNNCREPIEAVVASVPSIAFIALYVRYVACVALDENPAFGLHWRGQLWGTGSVPPPTATLWYQFGPPTMPFPPNGGTDVPRTDVPRTPK